MDVLKIYWEQQAREAKAICRQRMRAAEEEAIENARQEKEAYQTIQRLCGGLRKGTLPEYPRAAFKEAFTKAFAGYFEWNPEPAALYWSLDRVVAFIYTGDSDLIKGLISHLGMRAISDFVKAFADEGYLGIKFQYSLSDNITIPRFKRNEPHQP